MYKVMQSDTPPNVENLDEMLVQGWKFIAILSVGGFFLSYFISTDYGA